MPLGSTGNLRGRMQAQVHVVFEQRLAELAAQAAAQFLALRGQAVRTWQVPTALTGSVLDVPHLHEPAYDRTAINSNYETVMQTPAAVSDVTTQKVVQGSPGTVADAISLKHQMNHVAAEEQAFRVRHTSVCRAICHAMGRRYGHGTGGTFPQIREQAARIIQAGGLSQ